MPPRLPPGEVMDLPAVKNGRLLELDLDELPVPLRNGRLYVALDRVRGVGAQLPVAEERCGALCVPHADGGTGRMSMKSEGMRVRRRADAFLLRGRARRRQDLVAGASGDEVARQDVLPAVSCCQRRFQTL